MDEWLDHFRGPDAQPLIVVEKSGYNNPSFSYRARYGDRFVLAATATEAMHLAWGTWGSELAVLVYP